MTHDDRQVLLQLARTAIAAHLAGLPPPEAPPLGALARRGGVFVSLHADGSLRGCIGRLDAHHLIGPNVAGCAVSAATADPRFAPICAGDLGRLRIEISLVGPMEPIAAPAEVEVGRHGVMVAHGGRRGLLLPQVAVEWGWHSETFVAHTCRKAGLAADAWRRGAALWRFEAEVFGE